MSFFELGMLVCFGISWPINVYKTWREKSTKGKSIGFTLCIFVGYIAGIIHKFVYSRDFVLFVYLFNLLMVSADIVLFFYYQHRERQAT